MYMKTSGKKCQEEKIQNIFSGLLFPPKRKMSTLKIPVLRKWPHLTAHQEKKLMHGCSVHAAPEKGQGQCVCAHV